MAQWPTAPVRLTAAATHVRPYLQRDLARLQRLRPDLRVVRGPLSALVVQELPVRGCLRAAFHEGLGQRGREIQPVGLHQHLALQGADTAYPPVAKPQDSAAPVPTAPLRDTFEHGD